MDAKFIMETEEGLSIYYARTKKDTWPGYDESCPLEKKGYWYGRHGRHIHVGMSKAEALEYIERWG